MYLVADNYQPDGLNFSFKKIRRFVDKNVTSVKKDISINNAVKIAYKPISLVTGVKIDRVSDLSLNNGVKVIAKAAPIALAFVPGVGPVLAGVASGVLAPIGEKGTKIGFRDVNIRNAVNIAVSAGTSYATAGIGRGLNKLGGKIADGAIGRGADGIVNKLANTGAGRFVTKYANTTVGQIVKNQGRTLVKNAQNQLVDSITGAIVGTATNLLVKQPNEGDFTDSEAQPVETFTDSEKVPNTNQIQTIAKLSDKPVEQVVNEQITSKITEPAPSSAKETKGISTTVKVVGGIGVAGLIWYLVK